MAASLKDAIKARTQPAARGPAYAVGALATAPALPESAGALPEALQIIARNYIGARRRSGDALLDAARWLGEARAQAKHGEWQIFLEATGTNDTTASRLLAIHAEAMQNQQFADAVAHNWLTFTAAAEIAQQSTPPDVKKALLSAPKPPSKAQVQAARRDAKLPTVGNLPPIERRGVRACAAPTPAEPEPAPEPWQTIISQLRSAQAHAAALRVEAARLTGAQRRTIAQEIEILITTLEAAKQALTRAS